MAFSYGPQLRGLACSHSAETRCVSMRARKQRCTDLSVEADTSEAVLRQYLYFCTPALILLLISLARAEAALAAAAAETRRKQEEEERAAAEDAKRVVKKGFLDKRYSVCLLYWYKSTDTDAARASWTTSNPTDRTRA